jgi:hypothetical protein
MRMVTWLLPAQSLLGRPATKVIVDVSGESYVDLELEAIAMFKRD